MRSSPSCASTVEVHLWNLQACQCPASETAANSHESLELGHCLMMQFALPFSQHFLWLWHLFCSVQLFRPSPRLLFFIDDILCCKSLCQSFLIDLVQCFFCALHSRLQRSCSFEGLVFWEIEQLLKFACRGEPNLRQSSYFCPRVERFLVSRRDDSGREK